MSLLTLPLWLFFGILMIKFVFHLILMASEDTTSRVVKEKSEICTCIYVCTICTYGGLHLCSLGVTLHKNWKFWLGSQFWFSNIETRQASVQGLPLYWSRTTDVKTFCTNS